MITQRKKVWCATYTKETYDSTQEPLATSHIEATELYTTQTTPYQEGPTDANEKMQTAGLHIYSVRPQDTMPRLHGRHTREKAAPQNIHGRAEHSSRRPSQYDTHD